MKLPPEFVEMCVGIGGFMLIGGYLGYKLRKLVERVQARPKKMKPAAPREDRVFRAHPAKKPEFLPMKLDERQFVPGMSRSEAPSADRAEVIAALVNAGYKKTDAVKAVDACSLAERVSGVTMWMLAALRHAQGAK